jgi:SHS2 domain-containing protein
MLRIRKTYAMTYRFFDHTGDLGVSLSGRTVDELFASAAAAFTDSITTLAAVEPRRPEEMALAAPELDLLLVDFLSELLYRFDTRGWLTREAQVEVRDEDGGYALQGTLLGERLDEQRHPVKLAIKAVTYHGLHIVQTDETWSANIVFDI